MVLQSRWSSCLEFLPDSIKLATNTNRFKNPLIKNSSIPSHVLTLVSAPGQFVSRAI